MARERHGCKWTEDEDRQLKELFNAHYSFSEMAYKLGRTWFSCKCRLARLGVIPAFKNSEESWGLIGMEPYRVPNPEIPVTIITCEREEEEDTSNTFSDAELNVVLAYLKTRIAKITVDFCDSQCFVKSHELDMLRDTLEGEVSRVQHFKKTTIKEREKILRRMC